MNKITIITVCYNAETEIRRTIESVIKQSEKPYEYLIIDGKSKDRTVEVAKEFEGLFREAGVTYKIISEKDSGIYNAMNKGTRLAKGEWLLFLNAGDYLYEEQVINHIKNELSCDAEIVYGDAVYQLDTPARLQKKIAARPLDKIDEGMVFCHQCALIKKDLLLKVPYDESFKIAGDHNFFWGCYTKGVKFKAIDEAISVFVLGGASSNLLDHIEEDERIKYTWGNISDEEYCKRLKQAKRKRKIYATRMFIMGLLPKSFFIMLQERKYRNLGYRED